MKSAGAFQVRVEREIKPQMDGLKISARDLSG
jgi:hypothetical protein